MSKKSPYVLSHNLLKSHFNIKPTTEAICETFKPQQPSGKQQTLQNNEINLRRKLYKAVNTNKRYAATSRDKFRGCNYMQNNRRIIAVTKKNVVATADFNANSLWQHVSTRIEQDAENQVRAKWQYSKDFQKNLNESQNQNNNFKQSLNVVHLQNPQHQLKQNHHHQTSFHNLETNSSHKSFNTTYESHSPPTSRTLDKNHCHCLQRRAYERELKLLQLHDVIRSVSLSPTQRNKCHNQLTLSPPHVPHHHDILMGMFEVLPTLFLLKPSTCEIIKPKCQYHHRFHLLEYMKPQHQPDESKTKSRVFCPLHQRQDNFDNGGITINSQNKSKPSDRDVIFGNDCQLTSKRCSWESSRIEWLLKLEQEQQSCLKEN